MTKLVALFASGFLLTACVTPSSPPIDPPKPAIDPRLCADLKPEPDVLGAVVAPVTDQERADLAAFLGGEAAARDWGRQGWDRARIARMACHPPDS